MGSQKLYAYDFFVSHASEEKEKIVRPLVEALKSHRFRVWFDRDEIEIGYSLSECIERGIATSHFGIVVLSHSFIAKPWTLRELRGLVAKETIYARQAIIPIRHNMTIQEVHDFSPALSDQFSLDSSVGTSKIVESIFSLYQKEIRGIRRIANLQSIVRYMRHEVISGKIDAFDPTNFEEVSRQLDVSRFKKASVAIIDLDDLTKINRVHGIDVGNFVLVKTFEIIQKKIDETNQTFCRCGDDTFFIIAEKMTREGFESLAKEILASINLFQWHGYVKTLHVTASCGTASRKQGEPLRECIIRAAMGMNEAKKSNFFEAESRNIQDFIGTEESPKQRRRRKIKGLNLLKKKLNENDKSALKEFKSMTVRARYRFLSGPRQITHDTPRQYNKHWS